MARLDGKVALISGGSRGMGEAEAKLFAREGAKVILGDILDEQGGMIEAEINQTGGHAKYIHLDVTSENDWTAAVRETIDTYGKLNILVNNAGVAFGKGIEDTSGDEWDRVQNVNSKGVFLGTKAAIPAMREAGGGSIVNISSIAGIIGMPSAGMPSNGAYQASKGAVRIFTKSTAVQYGPEGIRCNSVHPGYIETDMMKDALSQPAYRASRLSKTLLGMIGSADDIALGVLYLASDESRYVTGAELVIDGGVTAQ